VQDGELESNGIGKLKLIWEGVIQTPLGELHGIVQLVLCFFFLN
jgi:hypothetical protein